MSRAQRPRLSREDWLDHGLTRLSEVGPDALKLAEICESAGVTRGSFYHHFEDHGAFLIAVAEHWIATQTDALLEAFPTDASPQERDRILTEMAMEIDYHVELGMREIARRHPSVAALVRAADARRLSFLAELYSARFGIDAEEAATAAKIEYATYVGVILIDSEISKTDQQHLADTFLAMMTKYFDRDV